MNATRSRYSGAVLHFLCGSPSNINGKSHEKESISLSYFQFPSVVEKHLSASNLLFIIAMNSIQGMLKFKFFLIHAGHTSLGCLWNITIVRGKCMINLPDRVLNGIAKIMSNHAAHSVSNSKWIN